MNQKMQKNYLEKTCRTTFFDASESAKNTFFCDVTKVENFDKKCLILSKENQKSPFKHIRFGRSKPHSERVKKFKNIFKNIS
jgi:hypothetical protein